MPRCGVIWSCSEKRFHKFFLVEHLEVIDAFTEADIFYRDFELVGDTYHHAAFGCAVELCNGKLVDVGGSHELACLFKGILPGGAVEHQEDFVRGIGYHFLHDVAYFRQLVHQSLLVMQTSGRVDNHNVDVVGFGRLERVECHCGGVAAEFLLYDRHACPFAPYVELFHGCGTECFRQP